MSAVTVTDIGMAALIIFGVGLAVLSIVSVIVWFMLRDGNKIGPLAKAQQAHEIEEYHVESVLKAKRAEAQIALADASIIEAQAKVAEAHAKARELDLERLDRQLTRGEHR